MNKKLKTEAVDHLFQAILTLKNTDECYSFFEDVCTVNELLSFSQRYEVAKMLREKKTYLEIADKTGASTATISRVNRSLNYGSDGYGICACERAGRGGENGSVRRSRNIRTIDKARTFIGMANQPAKDGQIWLGVELSQELAAG